MVVCEILSGLARGENQCLRIAMWVWAGLLGSPDPFGPVAPSFLRLHVGGQPCHVLAAARLQGLKATLPAQVVLQYLLIFHDAGYLPVLF